MSKVIEQTKVAEVKVGFPPEIQDKAGNTLYLLRIVNIGYDVPVYSRNLETAQRAVAVIVAGIVRQ